MSNYNIAIAGAGIYGSTIAIELAAKGHSVTLYDPLGILRAASVINQFRLHSGYHYPRSRETISEILEARNEFLEEYSASIVQGVETYYAIPHEGSRIDPETYEKTIQSFNLALKRVKPDWINFDFIDRCYAVDEAIYDPDTLRSLIETRLGSFNIDYLKQTFTDDLKNSYDFIIYATYGTSGSHMHLFESMKLQVAEKILIKLPETLNRKSLVVVDGPFTAFDPYGNAQYSQFGSALHTNHWMTSDPSEPIPDNYAAILNAPDFQKVEFTNFQSMVDEAEKAVPLCAGAEYRGSRFTLRLVEHDPSGDRRILRIGNSDERTFHVFSGKVVSAVKAAKVIAERIDNA